MSTSRAADVAEMLTAGRGVFLGSATSRALPSGWIEEERVATGVAASYRARNELTADGRFDLAEDVTASYRTRIVVRRPPADRFNGTVVVEWLNVSGGLDANPAFAYMADELFRGGYAWVGVSAQQIGVEGGDTLVSVAGGGGVAGRGIKSLDPDRYATLSHPGDAFAYDIYSQVGLAVRAGSVVGDVRPDRILAVGESQSAIMLTTYVDGVHPLTHVYDGFLIHSRGGSPAPLGEAGKSINLANSLGLPPTIIRTDLDVPVLVVETETDLLLVLRYAGARQDDTDRFRLWEIAGAAHADRYMLGPFADTLDCGGPVNDGPQRFIVRSALRALDQWTREGSAPSTADRLEIDGSGAFRRDNDGIVLGGIRTPLVDVPVDILSGEPRTTDQMICLLLGATSPLPATRIAERYSSRAAYLDEFTTSTDAAIAAGFVLPEDRDELLATAQPDRVS